MRQYQVSDESTIIISGGSSMHDWSCDVQAIGTMETDDAGVPTTAILEIPVENIECGKRGMNNKLRKALLVDDHPTIVFELASAAPAGTDSFKVTGTVKVAGKAKSIEADVAKSVRDANKLQFSGRVDMLMSDFDIKRPTAMLGAIKTQNELTVFFEIVMLEKQQ